LSDWRINEIYYTSILISIYWCWSDFKENCPKSMIAWAKKILCSKWEEFEEKFKEGNNDTF